MVSRKWLTMDANFPNFTVDYMLARRVGKFIPIDGSPSSYGYRPSIPWWIRETRTVFPVQPPKEKQRQKQFELMDCDCGSEIANNANPVGTDEMKTKIGNRSVTSTVNGVHLKTLNGLLILLLSTRAPT
jgi:hypothetical protein